MKFVEIKAKVPRPQPTPQCSEPVDLADCFQGYLEIRARRARAAGRDPARCTRASTVEINGKPYCRAHAGIKALRVLMSENRVKEV